jgi:uncharacterized protein YbjT (DUF2867 family)
MKILVTGATGTVGSEVAKALLQRGAEVRALTRKQPELGKLSDAVEITLGDLSDPVSVTQAMVGVDKLFLLIGNVADEFTQALTAYGLAKKAGLKHVTYLSVYQADRFLDVPHFAAKHAVEEAIREGGVPYTILRPGYFMQNDRRLKPLLTGPGVYPAGNRSGGRARYSGSGRDIPHRRGPCRQDIRFGLLRDAERSGRRSDMVQTPW